jgi:serine/threonine protein kinase
MSSSQQKQTDELFGKLFFNKYKPVKKLGEGSFGKIYSAVNITNQQKFALKMVKNYLNLSTNISFLNIGT